MPLCQFEKDERKLSAETKRALKKSEVNGKCSLKHFLSGRAVVFGQGGADHFIRGIFHSVGYVSSHASHQLQSPCVRNDCLCSSVVGQKHETAPSSSFITAFKFSLPAVETRLRNLVAIIWGEKTHIDVCYWMTTSFFKGMLCRCTVCPAQSYLVYETSGGVMAAFSASCFRDTLSETQCGIALLR